MFIKATLVGVALAVASPAFAEPGAVLRKSLDLEPGKYSLSELGQIYQTPSDERALRMMLIDRKKAAFRDQVRRIIEEERASPVASTAVR